MKLKDHIIRSKESSKPALECLQAIALGLALPLIIAVVIRIVNLIITGS